MPAKRPTKPKALPHVPDDEWVKLPPDQQAKALPCVPCKEWFALSDEQKAKKVSEGTAPAPSPGMVGTPGCACLPFGSGPGQWVWDGFNPVFMPAPTAQGQYFLVWDSNLGWVWVARN